VLNAANEEVVAAFLAGRLPFLGIVDTVAAVVGEHDVVTTPDLAAVLDAEAWARRRTAEILAAVGSPA
jgi:1-deoxy-D-xylulose-5-phosphate reductoisomerase